MKYINDFEHNEIFGLRYFIDYCEIKYKINIDEI